MQEEWGESLIFDIFIKLCYDVKRIILMADGVNDLSGILFQLIRFVSYAINHLEWLRSSDFRSLNL